MKKCIDFSTKSAHNCKQQKHKRCQQNYLVRILPFNKTISISNSCPMLKYFFEKKILFRNYFL